MNPMSHLKKLIVCALCVALCYVLPVVFHMVGLGTIFSPMHIPVLLCGLVCGGWYGLLCGLLGPVLSSIVSGMPPAIMLVRMIPELMAYGLVTGLGMRFIRTGSLLGDSYISMVIAMILGRVVGGVATAVYYAVTSGTYSFALWGATYFVESLPGILAQLVVIPAVVFTLEKARLTPVRYPKVTI